MYHICTTEKGAAQQHCFQKTLLSAMKQQNYEQITVTALCEQSGLSRKTFYRLFECKDDVLDALIDHTLQTYGVSQRSVTTIHDAFCRLFLYWQEQRTLLDALSRNNKTTLLIQRALIYTSSEAHDYTQYISFINTSCKQEILTFLVVF